MTQQNVPKTDLLAVLARLLMITLTLLSPIALIRDCTGGQTFDFTTDGQAETSDSTRSPFPGASSAAVGECLRPVDPIQLDRWIRDAAEREGVKRRLKNQPEKWEKYVKEVMATSMIIDEIERKRVKEDERLVCVPGLAYVSKSTIADFKRTFGKEPGEFAVLPVNDPKGVQYMDSRYGEPCFALEPAKNAWEKHLPGVRPDSCMRGIERQLSTKAIQVISCAENNTTPTREYIAACIKATNDTAASHLTGEHLWGVAFDSRTARTTKSSEAAAAGFYGGCRSNLDNDRDHMSLLLVKKETNGAKVAICEGSEGFKRAGRAIKKAIKNIFK